MENSIILSSWPSLLTRKNCSNNRTSNLFSECWTRTAMVSSKDPNSRKYSNVKFTLKLENGLNSMNGKSLDEVILSCDKDGNGIIDYNEFKAAMLL